ncbi:MAG: putative transporter [Bacteroidetes bacterium]|uniref:Transporter n=1 Tax=Candidatus Cryptobacteroides merdavium TaxID=2840769 RepID=A0A9D9HC43_9BACT|nr:putative transporter [Candidatus Cryptobacteroides merdavium]
MKELFFGQGTGHSIMLLAFVIAVGLLLGKIRIKGISLGSTWILFVGILLSHFGFRADSSLLHFLKEFGLILFVFSIGLQVGPGFFHSFKSGGLKLNLMAVALVLIGVITTYVIHLVSGENLVTLTGVMSGAVTNTPGLGAAQQTYLDATAGSFVHEIGSSDVASSLASGYAVAYPVGVLGVILVLMLTKSIFRVDLKKEEMEMHSKETGMDSPQRVSFRIKNPAVFGKTILEASHAIENKFIISRVSRDGVVKVPVASTVLEEGDAVLVVTAQSSLEAVTMLFGEQIDMPKEAWDKLDASMAVRKLTITRTSMTGKKLRELKIRTNYGVSITRVNRGGIDLVANPDLIVQMGDQLLVVGHDKDINQVAKFVGNSRTGLNHPNLIPIFFGIALGVLFGSIPIMIPGIPQAIKFGLAGGPLIIAILLGYFGPKLKITTYTTMSANLMLREIGISIFLAAVGLGAGENFVSSIVNGGYWWILYGALITLIPTALIAILGRVIFKLNFYQICGLVSGGCTNPPVLAFAQNAYGTDYTSVSYATVYPLAMFMRVLMAQILILIAVA